MLAATICVYGSICSFSYPCPFLSPLFGKIPYRQARYHRHCHPHPHHRCHLHYHYRKMIANVVPLADSVFITFRITFINVVCY